MAWRQDDVLQPWPICVSGPRAAVAKSGSAIAEGTTPVQLSAVAGEAGAVPSSGWHLL